MTSHDGHGERWFDHEAGPVADLQVSCGFGRLTRPLDRVDRSAARSSASKDAELLVLRQGQVGEDR